MCSRTRIGTLGTTLKGGTSIDKDTSAEERFALEIL